MRVEKKYIATEYVARLNASPFFLVVDYKGLTVGQFGELRKRLRGVGAEVHVVKNSIFRVAAKEAGVAELNGSLAGQLAVVTGQKEVSAAAKVLKTYQAEFDKPKIKFGYLNNQRLELSDILTLASLPSLEVLRAQFLALLNTPATSVARVLQARIDKGE